MNTVKQVHVDRVRSNTAYPVYRGIIGIISVILMIEAVLSGLGSVVTAVGLMQLNSGLGFLVAVIGIGVGVLSFFMARFFKEGAQILADIGDTVMEDHVADMEKATMR